MIGAVLVEIPMSKAFTKEDDSADEADLPIPAPIPSGKSYITPAGAQRLRDEFHRLRTIERPEVTKTVAWAASLGDRSENADYQYGKKKLREIDKRLEYLTKRLENVEVVDPLAVACDQVRFGATVTFMDEDGNEKTYAIVGVDEVDVAKGRISYHSPLGSALLKAREGDSVTFRSPKGSQEIEIVRIEYKEIRD